MIQYSNSHKDLVQEMLKLAPKEIASPHYSEKYQANNSCSGIWRDSHAHYCGRYMLSFQTFAVRSNIDIVVADVDSTRTSDAALSGVLIAASSCRQPFIPKLVYIQWKKRRLLLDYIYILDFAIQRKGLQRRPESTCNYQNDSRRQIDARLQKG